jgi:hypothetical protein
MLALVLTTSVRYSCQHMLLYLHKHADHVLSATRVVATGADRSHGQLIILGYREFIVQGTAWHPRGKLNDRLVLKTRAETNGLKFTPGSAPVLPDDTDTTANAGASGSGSGAVTAVAAAEPAEQHVAYAPDASVDMYQVGRLDCPENDFCVKGVLCVACYCYSLSYSIVLLLSSC